ncbi:helix-turn-helix domain-containing protein [Macrococcus equi]|uniref:helix-turn-helix domain-containing protein n=1 Tax=Macrococcus equi TaxID=3395462 RepID=UPI0039BECCB5
MIIKPKQLEIKIELIKQGYSIRSFAKENNISPSYLGEVLNLKLMPSSKYAKKISDALGVSFESIFEIEEEK